MNPAELRNKLLAIKAWIDQTLQAHAADARRVASLGFRRLPGYYPSELLTRASYVPIETVPQPPLSRLGVPGFEEFENLPADGITYLNTYFLRSESVELEALHFHELVHVVQWNHLGADTLILAYAIGYKLGGGYRGNPLETVAYDLEARFRHGTEPFDAVPLITAHADRFVAGLRQQFGPL